MAHADIYYGKETFEEVVEENASRMRQGLKVSLSLLVSLSICGGFAVFSFTGLFHTLESGFFQPRVVESSQARLSDFTGRIARYHEDNLNRFAPVLKERLLLSAFDSEQSREDIFNRANYFGKLQEDYPNLQGVRLVDTKAKAIHFSTFPADPREQLPTRIVYKDLADADATLQPEELIPPEGEPSTLFIDGEGDRFIYCLNVVDQLNRPRGVALFYFSKRDLEEYLLRFPALDFRELFLIHRLGVVINFPTASRQLVAEVIAETWASGTGALQGAQPLLFEGAEGAQQRYSLLTGAAGRFGFAGLLIPFSAFELQPLMKAVLLAAVFLTVFLIVFLLFNLRQEPLLVLSQRVKRMQLQILQEFVEGKERVDWQRWRDELVSSRSELRSRIKRGVGKLSAEKEGELDGLIDRSWDEIIAIIETRIGGPRKEAVDISYVEQLIQKALDRGQLHVATAAPASPLRQRREGGIVVEEIGVEEVVEPGAAAEVGEVLEAEEPAELEDAEELEAAAEVEEAGALEEVEEAEELEEADTLEEAAEVEEAGALEEVEEVEEAGALEEVEEVEEAGALEEAAEVEEVGALEEAAAAREEELPELEPVAEVVALPPLPQEELPELSLAEEAPEGLAAGAGTAPAVEDLESAEEEASPLEAMLQTGEELEMERTAGQRGSEALTAEQIEQLQHREEEQQLSRFVESGLIKAYTMAELEELIVDQRSSVVMEDGVFRIRGEILSGARSGTRKSVGGLKALAEAMLATSAEKERGKPESGIGALLGTELSLDLESEIGALEEREERRLLQGSGRQRRIQFYQDGLDYDGYLAAFRGGRSETDRLRSLVELSGRIRGVSAAVLVPSGPKFILGLKVGLMDPGVPIEFEQNEPFTRLFLKTRRVVLIRERAEKVKALAKKFHPEDLRYIHGAVFFPVVYQGKSAVLMLALPSRKHWEIRDIITQLDIY
jgi:hypothetical protein